MSKNIEKIEDDYNFLLKKMYENILIEMMSEPKRVVKLRKIIKEDTQIKTDKKLIKELFSKFLESSILDLELNMIKNKDKLRYDQKGIETLHKLIQTDMYIFETLKLFKDSTLKKVDYFNLSREDKQNRMYIFYIYTTINNEKVVLKIKYCSVVDITLYKMDENFEINTI